MRQPRGVVREVGLFTISAFVNVSSCKASDLSQSFRDLGQGFEDLGQGFRVSPKARDLCQGFQGFRSGLEFGRGLGFMVKGSGLRA